ncbi:MAG: peptide chain release factor N(5)-glutamine methyltransferase [Candidatus Moranbacteria bacterium]|nr:peptide chain release factor N(5)-glutamine methyltransferase [Candidatus Moranbacteria bacterium]
MKRANKAKGGKTIKAILNQAAQKLKKASTTPELDAEVLTGYALNKKRSWLFSNLQQKIDPNKTQKIESLIEKRAEQVPIAYLIKKKEFFNLEFKVTKDVLVPRPETETLVEQSLIKLKKSLQHPGKILFIDIGTASGCIIISIIKELQRKKIINGLNKLDFFATDISGKALKVAKCNAEKHQISDKIDFFSGSLLKPILTLINTGGYSQVVIASNLPYISKEKYEKAKKTIKFEPKKALLAGDGGLKVIRKLLEQLNNLAGLGEIRDIAAMLEIDSEQAHRIKKIIKQLNNLKLIGFSKDLNRKDRVATVINKCTMG